MPQTSVSALGRSLVPDDQICHQNPIHFPNRILVNTAPTGWFSGRNFSLSNRAVNLGSQPQSLANLLNIQLQNPFGSSRAELRDQDADLIAIHDGFNGDPVLVRQVVDGGGVEAGQDADHRV